MASMYLTGTCFVAMSGMGRFIRTPAKLTSSDLTKEARTKKALMKNHEADLKLICSAMKRENVDSISFVIYMKLQPLRASFFSLADIHRITNSAYRDRHRIPRQSLPEGTTEN